jgi:hypothetical protein
VSDEPPPPADAVFVGVNDEFIPFAHRRFRAIGAVADLAGGAGPDRAAHGGAAAPVAAADGGCGGAVPASRRQPP